MSTVASDGEKNGRGRLGCIQREKTPSKGAEPSQTLTTPLGRDHSLDDTNARLLPLRLWYVVLCQHMPRCISIYVSAPAATARPLSFRTPTVASGTVVFVNATPVVSYKSPEWSGPDKHRHGGFRLFFPLFPGRGEWSPDSEATFKHYHIRKWIASQFREQAVLDELPGEANLDGSPEEQKVRKRKKKRHLIYMIFGMIEHRDLIICSLYSEHLHITRSWLWLKQNPLSLWTLI